MLVVPLAWTYQHLAFCSLCVLRITRRLDWLSSFTILTSTSIYKRVHLSESPEAKKWIILFLVVLTTWATNRVCRSVTANTMTKYWYEETKARSQSYLIKRNFFFFFKCLNLTAVITYVRFLLACIGFQKRKQKVTFSGTGWEEWDGLVDRGFVYIMDI